MFNPNEPMFSFRTIDDGSGDGLLYAVTTRLASISTPIEYDGTLEECQWRIQQLNNDVDDIVNEWLLGENREVPEAEREIVRFKAECEVVLDNFEF